jgi:hypothetical protein
MNIWAIKSRKQKQKNLEKEMLLASKIDKTDYNNFIQKKIENKQKNNLRVKAYNANKKLLKQNNIIVIDDIKNNNIDEINNKVIENVKNINMETVKKTPKKSFSITNSSEIQNNKTNLIDTPSKKISKKKELLYTSALSPTILTVQTNKNKKSNCTFNNAINNFNIENNINNNIVNYDILNDFNNYENFGNFENNNLPGKLFLKFFIF